MWNKLWHRTMAAIFLQLSRPTLAWPTLEAGLKSLPDLQWRPAKGSRGRVKEGSQAKHRPRILFVLFSPSPSFVPVRFGWNPSPLHGRLTTIWVWEEEKERRKGGCAAQTRVEMRVILGSDVITSYYEANGITESWQQLGFCFPKVANKKLYSCSSLCENCPR